MTAAAAIRTRGLTKRFRRVLAVDHVDLDVPAGAIYGFLGPNGSGKTTTVRMLLGLVFASAGSIEVLGAPMPQAAHRVLPRVGALVEGPAFPGALPGRVALARLDAAGPGGPHRNRANRIAETLQRVGLADIDDRPVKAYSLGMKQRLGLAAALLCRPDLLILDEPTNGLDPQGIREIRDLLRRLNADGTTVFLSSHLLVEVETLCDVVGIVNGGRLIAQDAVARLRAPTGRLLLRTSAPAAAQAELGSAAEPAGDGWLGISSADPAGVNARLVAAGVPVEELVVERRTLEDVFLALTEPDEDRPRSAQPVSAP